MISELSDRDLKKRASGGYRYNYGSDYKRPFEVIDDETGDVLRRFSREDDAVIWAADHNISPKNISWRKLKELRDY